MTDKETKETKETAAPEETTAAETVETAAPEAEAVKEDKKSKKSKKEKDKQEDEALKEELRGANDRYLRLLAEYDNFRKRSQKEKEKLYGDIRAEAVTGFLPVYDNLLRALAQPTEDEAYRKGVEMILNQFCATLEKLGVKKIESLGQSFDPAFHNAVMHIDDEEKGENEIVEVFQEGFLLGDKVIRFAMVKVAN